MDKEFLLEALTTISKEATDPIIGHEDADRLLLDFIDDDDVYIVWDQIEKFYG